MTDNAIEPSYKKRITYQGALLAAFATLAATLLVMANLSTHATIQQRLNEDLQASLAQVIPDDMHDNNLLENRIHIEYQDKTVLVYQGIKDGDTTAVAYNVTGQGYAGEIALIMGVNANGEILGVRVLSHAETPGLGDKIEAQKDDWIFSFDGLSFNKLDRSRWHVKKDGGDFDQFSGATITPRAVVKAIAEGLELFNAKKNLMLSNNLKVNSTETPPGTINLDKTNAENTAHE